MALTTTFGLDDLIDTWIDPEDGERRMRIDPCYRIQVIDDYGVEYTLRHAFAFTEDGYRSCAATHARVQAQVAKHGLAGLNLALWADRVIYGSQAYCDEEPYIVEREKSDALCYY